MESNVVVPYANPATGKGWSEREEDIIFRLMTDESCTRIEAIQAMRRRKLDDLRGGTLARDVDNTSADATRIQWTIAPRPEMTERMAEFVEKYRLRPNDKKLAQRYRLSWAEAVVPGKYGEIADMGDTDALRLRLLAVPRSAVMNGALLRRRREALAGGMLLKVKASSESILLFDPKDAWQAELAIRLVGARRRRRLSPEQRAALTEQLRNVRQSATS
jgi:hypothetical protein